MTTPVVAVVGGGQLARMMQEEASALGIHLRVLVESGEGSAGQVTVDAPVGAADDATALRRLVSGRHGEEAEGARGFCAGQAADVLTFEHEHQDTSLLTSLQSEGLSVQPSPQALLLAQDKRVMRQAVARAGLPQPAWAEVGAMAGGTVRRAGTSAAEAVPESTAGVTADTMAADVRAFAEVHGWPVVLKTPRGGYDGHGVLLVHDAAALDEGPARDWLTAVAAAAAGDTGSSTGGGGSLGGGAVTSLLVEQAVPFSRELAVLVARSPRGQVEAWPAVQTVQASGMCVEAVAPAPGLDPVAAEEAQRIARTVAEEFQVTGVLAVEMFCVEEPDGPARLYVNELATRPHNSGHWTQDGAVTSQFAQHLRAVLGLPLGSAALTAAATVMVNLLGGPQPPGEDALARALALEPRARIHLYGKSWRPGRKLGHVNLTVAPTETPQDALERAREVVAVLRGEG
ncbi:ATP-grasp domain-containing protein [Actinomyces sp. 2119]|uniref:N5-carboxyaminoimidazole ribonucleotide synthase n=1 Tax=Actinomyces lilanjuaniae TaxID=2321394 RepID=A0ABM6Z4H4_9ACTO|nr:MULTISPECIES: ATP-grasp domain-containing protein [Actinomyces]AYD90276.1 ATP-grasp domain-containing protein [Actinomyces lilanjuaniae]RJF41542.1 ATP-grasp domain-containing protein [Actinomyces sp. 2119]